MAEVLEKMWEVEEFLAFERASEQKHELILGELYPMSGVSFKYNRIAKNILVLLENLFQNTQFETFGSDLRVANLIDNSFCYPDITVIAGEPIFIDKEFDTITNPILIAEALSVGTQQYDNEKKKGKKFDVYKEN